MSLAKYIDTLSTEIASIEESGTAKGHERVVTAFIPPAEKKGPRFLLEGFGDKQFIRMNSNSYLGLSVHPKLIKAEEEAAKKYGVGPGAVRFISGTYKPHAELERKLAAFHHREDCLLTSSAYTSVLGVIVTLCTPETIIISDELNHNCIINAMKLARPKDRKVYRHVNMADFEHKIVESIGQCETILVVTDGVFSMRGVFAPLLTICELAEKYNDMFLRGIVVIVDDSHGVGALGKTGRGTEEITQAKGVDIIVATLGKAFGVNGGYVCSSKEVIRYLRERNQFYIFTNPITQGEAAAGVAAIDILDSSEGRDLLMHLHSMTVFFRNGLIALGYETLASPHPVVPLLVRETEKTAKLVAYLFDHGVLATGLNYPIVPKGDQLIRFQVNASHTLHDLETVLGVLATFKRQHWSK
ncbi:7-keto-8-aminopelargonate synthetase [candidate division GN15 bacterium]|uniref:7-keto-8-aminopelargonate synthetase n=1 Tax=candidate division GN15 bacterium TaxID=2072418 RepID=A0A855XCT8_9BACT|nr:MAG: 7-keto-8-aminopelargonate synthetase [candidate division GN15 bacterium]